MAENTNSAPNIPDFCDAIKTCFRKYADFKGRASRSEFWYWTLFITLVQTPLAMTAIVSLFLTIGLLAIQANEDDVTTRANIERAEENVGADEFDLAEAEDATTEEETTGDEIDEIPTNSAERLVDENGTVEDGTLVNGESEGEIEVENAEAEAPEAEEAEQEAARVSVKGLSKAELTRLIKKLRAPTGVCAFVFLGSFALLTLFGLATLTPNIAACVRRLHDVGLTGWLWLLALVQGGNLALLIICALPPTSGENKYGLEPKKR